MLHCVKTVILKSQRFLSLIGALGECLFAENILMNCHSTECCKCFMWKSIFQQQLYSVCVYNFFRYDLNCILSFPTSWLINLSSFQDLISTLFVLQTIPLVFLNKQSYMEFLTQSYARLRRSTKGQRGWGKLEEQGVSESSIQFGVIWGRSDLSDPIW